MLYECGTWHDHQIREVMYVLRYLDDMLVGSSSDRTYVYLDEIDAGAEFAGRYGHVKMVYQGLDGRVCASSWGDENANVTCKELGFKGGVAYK